MTLRDVAAAARVHVATASRALDAETAHPVSPKTRARVQQVAEELGYRHHMMARGLRRGFSSTVGVVVADLGNPYTAPVLRGIQAILEQAGHMALVAESRDDSQALERAVDHLLARQVDGLILLAARAGDLQPILGWTARVPVVLAVRSLPGSGVPAVWVLAAVAVALVGLAPRFAAVAWGALGLCVILGLIGPALRLDQWIMDLSPFTHVPKVPGAALTATPLVLLLAVALAAGGAGLVGLRRRGIPAT